MKRKILAFVLFVSTQMIALTGVEKYYIRSIEIAGSEGCVPTDINQNGQVCGVAKLSSGFFSSTYGVFVWDASLGPQLLETAPITSPIINDVGQVAFTETLSSWFSSQKTVCLWDPKEGLKHLEVPKDWANAFARDMNNQGEILIMDKGVKTCKCNPYAKVRIYQDQLPSTTDLSEIQQGDKINQFSQVLGIGFRYVGLKETSFPVVIDPLTHRVHTLSFSDAAYGTDLNDLGQVVGQFYDAESKQWKGFFWDLQKGIQTLEQFLPTAMNNKGQIVGLDSKQTPVIWDNGEIKDIELISRPEPGSEMKWQKILKLYGINDKGHIIGWGKANDMIQAFILIPVE